eukprot:g984.t1
MEEQYSQQMYHQIGIHRNLTVLNRRRLSECEILNSGISSLNANCHMNLMVEIGKLDRLTVSGVGNPIVDRKRGGLHFLVRDTLICVDCELNAVCIGGNPPTTRAGYWQDNKTKKRFKCEGVEDDNPCGATALTIKGGGKAGAVDLVVAKIGINHLIIASSARLFPLKWPEFVETFFLGMTIASASALGDSGLSTDCVLRQSALRPVQSWAVAISIAVPGLALLQCAFWAFWRAFRVSNASRIGLRVSTMITLLLAHPTLTKAAIGLVACRRVAGIPYLNRDLKLRCDSEEYIAWLALAFPMLLVFALGIPLVYFVILRRHVSRGTLKEHRDVYGYLTSGYTDENYWFELWNTARKGLFSASALLSAPLGVAMQTWMALLLLMSFIAVFASAKPYAQSFLNQLERQALVVDVLTLFFGIALFNNATNDVDQQSPGFAITLSVLIVVMNTVFMGRLFWVLRRETQYGPAFRQFLSKLFKIGSSTDNEVNRRSHEARPRISMVNFSKWMQNEIATVKSDVPITDEISNSWAKRFSQDHERPYFESLETGETSWDLPDGAHVKGEHLPQGWEVRYSSEEKRI